MLRVRQRKALLGVIGITQGNKSRMPSSANCVSRCAYTPINESDLATDQLAPIRHADELQTLWSEEIPIPSLKRAIEVWLRFGHDPVLHTALPTRHRSGYLRWDPNSKTSKEKLFGSPFAYAEDYMGTNLVRDDSVQIKESADLWREFFEKKFSIRLRQSCRTSANFIGRLNAPEIFTDEADQPSTRWPSEPHFREMAYLSERYLKEKVMNPLQLDEILWFKSDVDKFLTFFSACHHETSTRIPLPVPSVWVYEGDARAQWAERYLPVARAAYSFFKSVLSVDLKKFKSASDLLRRVAEAMQQVHQVLLRRRNRQQRQGIFCPKGWSHASPTEKKAWTANEVERWQRSVHEGVFDPEDLLEFGEGDAVSEWLKENEAIQEILSAPVKDCSFTLQDFWLHTIRREALETEHILVNERLCEIDAASRRALYDSVESYATILEALEESIAKGWLDMRATVFHPYTNPVWCALHYAKFGSSSIVQHTNTAKRQLLFYHAASLKEVSAAAQLYYSIKARSERLDYASPNTLRRSLTQLCAAYGLDMMHAAQRPILLSAENLAKAEDVIQRISYLVAQRFGVQRRTRHAQIRLKNSKRLPAVSKVVVSEPESELLETGTNDRPTAFSSHHQQWEVTTVWAMGSRKVVHYHWPTPLLERLNVLSESASIHGNDHEGLTKEEMDELQSLLRRGIVEISLWRRRTHEECETERTQGVLEKRELMLLTQTVPELKEIFTYCERLYGRLNREPITKLADRSFDSKEGETAVEAAAGEEEWVFAAMLDDRAPLNQREAREVYLPFVDSTGRKLKEGHYCVRVRAYDAELNPRRHPTVCTEAYSNPFQIKDVLPQLLENFFQTNPTNSPADIGERIPCDSRRLPGTELIPLCEFLREKGHLDVPLHLEFDVGQELDARGTFSLSRLCDLLRGDAYHRSLAEYDITDAQRRIEQKCREHWSLYHAGSNEEEWACARRLVLDEAMIHQRDWWHEDAVLEVRDVATSSVDGSLDPALYASTMRYGAELCTVLQALGSTHEDDTFPDASDDEINKQLQVDCVVDGTGAIVSLAFRNGGMAKDPSISIDQALTAALIAAQRAQDRHRTLSAFKLGSIEKQMQTLNFCDVHNSERGGKYARTFCYVLAKAKEELAETMAVGRRVLGTEDLDTERLSDKTTVDRFASDTHPEQRKKLFTPRVTRSGIGLDDSTPDQTSTWGR